MLVLHVALVLLGRQCIFTVRYQFGEHKLYAGEGFSLLISNKKSLWLIAVENKTVS